MLASHPILAILHLVDGRIYKPKPVKKRHLTLVSQPHSKSEKSMSV
jgi:hypothetical protein